jgi:hypothetical protein
MEFAQKWNKFGKIQTKSSKKGNGKMECRWQIYPIPFIHPFLLPKKSSKKLSPEGILTDGKWQKWEHFWLALFPIGD